MNSPETEPSIYTMHADDVLDLLETTRPDDAPPLRFRLRQDRRRRNEPPPDGQDRRRRDISNER